MKEYLVILQHIFVQYSLSTETIHSLKLQPASFPLNSTTEGLSLMQIIIYLIYRHVKTQTSGFRLHLFIRHKIYVKSDVTQACIATTRYIIFLSNHEICRGFWLRGVRRVYHDSHCNPASPARLIK